MPRVIRIERVDAPAPAEDVRAADREALAAAKAKFTRRAQARKKREEGDE